MDVATIHAHISTTAFAICAFRCTGKERDQESGLDYFGARFYGSALGRFTSPDEFKSGIVDPFTGQDIETNTALPYADITDPNTAWGIAPAGPTSHVYNNSNQASTLTYDGSGRVTSTGSTSFSYDAENRQTQATDAPGIGGGTVTYAYDGAGERVKKQISAQRRRFVSTIIWAAYGSFTDQNANVISQHDYLPLGEEIPGRHSRPLRVAYLLRARQIAQWPWQKTPTEVTRQTG